MAKEQAIPAISRPVTIPMTMTFRETPQSFVALEKKFSTGSTGYYATGKLIDALTGDRYQVGCLITLIGSKPTSKSGKK